MKSSLLKSTGNALALTAALNGMNLAARAQAAPANPVVPASPLRARFVTPPADARPWVYWYFMDGHITREGIRTDLEAMKNAGIGGAIFLTVSIGIPQGPVAFMSAEWQQLFAYAVSESKRQNIEIALGTGPGWAGSGGPWVKPEMSMQHLVSSETSIVGPTRFDAVLPRPKPRTPYFGEGSLTPELRKQWNDFYRDETVIAFPTPAGNARLSKIDDKALYYRAPYTSVANVPPRIDASADATPVPSGETINATKVVVLTSKMAADGRLTWDVPPGNWTVLRFGRTLTGQTTRPAPQAGLGFESDKFSRPAAQAQLDDYVGTIFKQVGPELRNRNAGLTFLHFDSWEMGSQNWSSGFRQQFVARRGYDPTPYLPAMSGYVVGTAERSERFLWDLRQTASELVIENHALPLRAYAHQRGLKFSVEPYDMNPAGDLDLGATADLPMGEFWSRGYGYDATYSVLEAVSVGHTNGKSVIGAESFTAAGDYWRLYPGAMKAQLDWALCAGLNKIVFHTYQHQPDVNRFPGMTMGPYGVHWERTQTWWDMVPAFHQYITRSSEMLRQGAPVADILYLTPEGAPDVFTPPADALTSELPDRKGYGFDGCSPRTLMQNATVRNGQIVFPGGASYRVLVLPQWPTMTPQLLRKLNELARAGATIIGSPPSSSPSLSNFPAADAQVRALAAQLWGPGTRKVGKGRVIRASIPPAKSGPSLEDARWIWSAEGNPASSAPVGTRYFRTTIEVDANRKLQDAVALMTADNSFQLFINDKLVGSGNNFRRIESFDVKSYLRAGTNQVRVEAVNDSDTPTGATPNPAGLIGAIRVFYTDGSRKSWTTGASWQAALSAEGPQNAAQELGESKMGPWNLQSPTAPIYQPYAATAAALSGMGVAPDFASGAPMRAIHRRLPDGELYFIANKSEQPIQTVASFRTTGLAPQWWNPLNGETRLLPDYSSAGGVTKVPVRLAGLESGFVIFRKPTARKVGAGQNFPQAQAVLTLSRPWNVSFDPKRGGPANVVFPTLSDWSQNATDGIKYYSGKAVYRTSFDVAAPTAPGYRLSLGSVKNLASVRINGQDLGSVWCEPWSVNIPAGLLKPTGNELEVTVANLWVNRLIGDNDKPADQRFTSTTAGKVFSEKDLQPSGLLGPVRLMQAR